MGLSREDLLSDAFIERLRAGLAQDGLSIPLLTREELEASLQAALAERPPGGEIWLFGYGSLMWNPCLDFAERREATAGGWHRRFCLWTPSGRGTAANPGLVLGLEPGGRCQGVAFRLVPQTAVDELRLVWRREMLADSYCPRWLPVDLGDRAVEALTFVSNPAHSRYCPEVPDDTVIRHLATAAGHLGSAREYLEQTIACLDRLGLEDRALQDLWARVARWSDTA